MIHIDGKEISICEEGYASLVFAYALRIREDYEAAVARKNIKKMTEIEKHVLSGKFWGEIIGISSAAMVANLRDCYDHNRFLVTRDKNTLLPIAVTEI